MVPFNISCFVDVFGFALYFKNMFIVTLKDLQKGQFTIWDCELNRFILPFWNYYWEKVFGFDGESTIKM